MISADTNVFAYLYDDDSPEKQGVSRELVRRLAGQECIVGLQVVGELTNALRRKLKKTPAASAQAGRNLMRGFPTFLPTAEAAAWALDQAAAATLQYWDALLVASAHRAGVRILLSEDMADGAEIGGVLIVNPYAEGGLSQTARRVLEL